MFVSFSNMHLKVHIANLLWIQVELRNILILFFAFPIDDILRRVLGEAMYN